MTSDFRIQPLAKAGRETFASLARTYLAEIAPSLDQRAQDRIANSWADPNKEVYAFLDDQMFGFAIIRRLDEEFHEMSEFYIDPAHRRRGIGRAAAIDVVRRHPGKWRLGIVSGSDRARSFWMQALKTHPMVFGPPLTAHQSGSLQFTVTETVT